MQGSAKEELYKYWYLRSEQEVLGNLKTAREGLTDAEAEERLKRDGLNTLAKDDKLKFLKILVHNFNNLLIYVLLAAAIISIFSDHLVEFVAIMIIILFTGFLGFFQEFRAMKSIQALSKLTAKKVNVLRSGKWKEIDATHLVRGDIISLKRGMIVPADLRIIETSTLSIDESILTGESVQKYKVTSKLRKQDIPVADQDNMAFSGTSVANGSGIGVVVEVGLGSELGKISKQLASIKEKPSPLHRQMNSVSKRISIAVIAVAVLFFFYLLARGEPVAGSLLLISVIAVSGIPESLPLALTVTLSQGVKTMAKHNAIVKDLNSVETLGTTTVICTDKTGTLTQNRMVVERIALADGTIIKVKGKGYEPNSEFMKGNKKITPKNIKCAEQLFKASILCNNARIEMEDGEWKLDGEPTEGALIALVKSAGFDDEVVKEDFQRLHEVPFDPSKKFMITINKTGSKQTAYLKGAVEKVLSKCIYIRTPSGKIKKLAKEELNAIHKNVARFTDRSYRVLGFGTKMLGSFDKKSPNKSLDKGYIFEGMVAIKDPIRPEVIDSVRECHQAGIRVIMVTGDHKKTAESIGKSIGIIDEEHDLVIEGTQVDRMTDDELDEVIDKVAIFARSTPEHKLRIVNSLQRKGEIAAMTGDGVNDAPALKQADIGVSMGKNGTDVARESSNMVLADDNFSTIVNAVKEGRRIYSNIRRFLYYLLAGNMTEVSLLVITVLIGLASPLTALMVLYVNLVTSSLPAFALSVEPMHPKVMRQTPRNPKEKILSFYLVEKILVLVPILFLGTFSLFLWEMRGPDPLIDKARTLAFVGIIMFEMFHAFNAKSLHTSIFNKNLFRNKHLFIAIGASIGLTVLAVYNGFLQSVLGTVPLSGKEWAIIIGVSSLVIVVSEIIKKMIASEFREQANLQGVEVRFE
ncbi:MAG TPA: HAD family hydrolase [Candidatus Woesearchaeota archaeon]|mgnify:CR=1 FL=1|nr:HAD family hydrolase [Candidatus Woesearchaeota archaeon]